MMDYKKTKQGLIAAIYSDQRRNSRRRNHPEPEYDLGELRLWVETQPLFEPLYNMWLLSGFDRWSRPSFDRKENDKHYTLDNIQIMTAYDNLKKEKVNPKPIRRSDGREYESIISAEREHGYPLGKSKISLVCNGIRKSYKGYTWEFINKEDCRYDLETNT